MTAQDDDKNSVSIGLGSVVAAGTAPFLKWIFNYQMSIEAQFIMAALAFTLGMLWTCITIKEKTSLKNLLISLIGAGISCIALFFTEITLFYVSVCEVLAVLLCLKLSQNTDRRKNLFFCIMYEIAVFLWSFIFGEALAVISSMSDFSDRKILLGQLPLWLVNAVLIIAAVAIYKGRKITVKVVSFGAILTIFGVVILSDSQGVSEDMAFIYLVFSLILSA